MNIKIKLINNNLEKWMKNRYSGNLTKLHVFNALLFWKSVELYTCNHKEWSILIFIRKNYEISNETFKQLYDIYNSILV